MADGDHPSAWWLFWRKDRKISPFIGGDVWLRAVLDYPVDAYDVFAQCADLIQRTLDEYRRIDELVSPAGITVWANLEEVSNSSIFFL